MTRGHHDYRLEHFSTHLLRASFFFKNKLKLDYFVARGLVNIHRRNFGADHFYVSVQRDSDEDEDDDGLFLF